MLNALCKRDWCVVEMYPVWPIGSRDLAPSTLCIYLPPYLPGVMGIQLTGSLQEGWTWSVEWRFATSPTQILWLWIMYVILSLFHLESCFWSVYQMIVCLLLIAVIFLGWLTTTRNKRVLPCAFITFPGLVCNTHYMLCHCTVCIHMLASIIPMLWCLWFFMLYVQTLYV